MDLKGETMIAAPRERVWTALNDPDVLARCIDGVEVLTRVGDNRFEGKMNAKVGPVRATFTGGVTLENIDPPNGYTLVGEGKGGVAGFAKGAAEVTLADAALDDGSTGTLLAYHAKSQVGGKLAQLGARLVEGTAKAYAESFFAKLKAEVEAPATPVDDSPLFATGDTVAAAAASEITPLAMAGGPTPPVGTGPHPASRPTPDDASPPASRGLSPLAWGLVLVALTVLVIMFLLLA